jgi:hypothetical protein
LAQQRQVNKPIKMNRDKDPKYLGADEASYLLNAERNIGGGTKSTSGKTTPLPANELICTTEVESGTPYSIGSFKSDLTNEVYSFYYNDGGIHYILRVNADKTCEIVYQGECLQLSADPKHAIENWRVYLKYDKFCAHMGGKQLIWTDGLNPIGQIDVEASIATDSFTTPFFDVCPDECAPIQMCVPEICGAVEPSFVPLESGEEFLNNKMQEVGVQIMIRQIYYDQRAGEYSDISTLIYQDGIVCFTGEIDAPPRCITFRVPIGNPLVERIEILFRTNNQTQWYLSDTIDKYEAYTSEGQKWYERDLADLPGYSDEDCSFDYTFCNDKSCEPVDVNQTNRVFNPIPREAQGLIRVKDSLGFYNYVKGNCPLLESETKKFELSLNSSPNVGTCDPEFVSVTFFAVVHRVGYGQDFNMPIFRLGVGTSGLNSPDDKTDKAYFGGAQFNGAAVPTDEFGQYFSGDTRNFTGAVNGTNYWTTMKQYVKSAVAGSAPQLLDAPIAGLSDPGFAFALRNLRQAGTYYFQQGVINVPKGTRGFLSLISHTLTSGVIGNQDTSTQVIGTLPSLLTYQANAFNSDVIDLVTVGKEEIYFDTCDGAVYLDEPFFILDYDVTAAGEVLPIPSSSAASGYIKDVAGNALEGLEVWVDGTKESVTDHNGYYHFNLLPGVTATTTLDIRAERTPTGAWTNIHNEVIEMARYQNLGTDITITEPTYQEDYFEDVQVLVQDCDSNPVGGVRVAMSGSQFQVSDETTGIATFRLRNYSSRAREVRAVLMDANNCFNISCAGDCNPCMPITNLTTLSSSFSGVPYLNLAFTSLLNISTATLNTKGLKAGGRYEWALIAKGSCGKLSAAYPITIMNGSIPEVDSYMNVPKTQEKNALSFNDLSYDATGFVAPDWADCILLARSKNNDSYELQWIVDKIEDIDNQKIRITIQSLNDYNASYDFRSNTIYQFQEGDRVEFISNGDGNILDTATYGLLNYKILSPFYDRMENGDQDPPDADYFNQILIEDDGRLPAIEVGAKIELKRPKDCTLENTGFFAVLQLPLIEVSGQKVLLNPTGTFLTFDTYFVKRLIGTTNIQVFEHRNPSDFWGDTLFGISDIGKPYFKNKFENEKRWGRNITINAVNQFNRFGDLEKTLDAPEQGDITSIGIYDGSVGLGIGEYDNFLFQIADDFLRVGSDGLVRAAPVDALISDTQPKVQGQFGCQYDHIGSVFYGDGFVTWADVAKGAYVKHDFNVARDIAEGKMNTYFRQKWGIMQAFNATSGEDVDRYRFITGFNYFTNALQLTMKQLSGEGINNEKDFLLANNETILIELRTEDFLTAASYTPESYSNLNVSDANGCAFICFRGNSVYLHPIKTTIYNRFFGEAVDRVATIAINQNPDIEKRAVGLEIQDDLMWFVTKVLVDRSSFESEIPPIKMTKQEDKWVASFLADKNSRGGLYATGSIATKPRGYYVLVTFTRDNTDALKYNTTNDAKRILFSSLDMILFKYFYSADSGMIENL